MSEPSAQEAAAYREAIARLQEWLRRRYGVQGEEKKKRSKALRSELKKIEAALHTLADRVEFGLAWSVLDDARSPPFSPGDDDVPSPILLRCMSAAVERVRKDVPDPRAQPFIAHAALMFLHVRYRHRQSTPAQSLTHPAVVEFADLMQAASGGERGLDGALSYIKGALRRFDRSMPPEGLDEIV